MITRDRYYRLIGTFLAVITATYPYKAASALPSNTISENETISKANSQVIIEFRVQKLGTESQFSEQMAALLPLELERKQLEAKGDRAALTKVEQQINSINQKISSLFSRSQLDDRDIENAAQEGLGQQWRVAVRFNRQGARKFAEITKQLAGTGRSIGIFHQGKLISAPTVDAKFAKEGIVGGAAIIEGNFTAKESYELALQLNEKSALTPAQKAAALFESAISQGSERFYQKDFSGAIARFKEAIQLEPQNARGYIARGRAQAAVQKWQEAIADYELALTIEPSDVNVYWLLATAKEEAKDVDGAIAAYEKIRKIAPHSAVLYYYQPLLRYYLAAGKKQDLLAVIDSAAKDPLSNNWQKGVALIEFKDYSGAISYLNRAISIQPQDTGSYLYRAIAYEELGDRKAALQDYQKVVSIEPEDSVPKPEGESLKILYDSYLGRAYYHRGVAYARLKNWKSALQDLNKSISLDRSSSAYRQRSLVRQELKDEVGAKEDADRATELSPVQPNIVYLPF